MAQQPLQGEDRLLLPREELEPIELDGRERPAVGQGDRDLELLRIIAHSDYRGPIGILGHTQDDAEARLQDNLDGLAWLLARLKGQAPPPPQPRTYKG
ncbi:MAG TPA: hypothetical protein PLU22_14555, partial [Polyangiaceae bacterium]|nr:hypothetical protein [Polyangiaceae bacterium]